MGISESISQLPSDDFTVACVVTIIFFLIECAVKPRPSGLGI